MFPAHPRTDVGQLTEVVELRDHDSLEYAGMTVSVRNNTHYSFAPDSDLAGRFESLSFRFDLPGAPSFTPATQDPALRLRSWLLALTLLVAEMMDVDDTIAEVRGNNPNMPDAVATGIERHLRDHHLLPRDVGEMASRAGVMARSLSPISLAAK